MASRPPARTTGPQVAAPPAAVNLDPAVDAVVVNKMPLFVRLRMMTCALWTTDGRPSMTAGGFCAAGRVGAWTGAVTAGVLPEIRSGPGSSTIKLRS